MARSLIVTTAALAYVAVASFITRTNVSFAFADAMKVERASQTNFHSLFPIASQTNFLFQRLSLLIAGMGHLVDVEKSYAYL